MSNQKKHKKARKNKAIEHTLSEYEYKAGNASNMTEAVRVVYVAVDETADNLKANAVIGDETAVKRVTAYGRDSVKMMRDVTVGEDYSLEVQQIGIMRWPGGRRDQPYLKYNQMQLTPIKRKKAKKKFDVNFDFKTPAEAKAEPARTRVSFFGVATEFHDHTEGNGQSVTISGPEDYLRVADYSEREYTLNEIMFYVDAVIADHIVFKKSAKYGLVLNQEEYSDHIIEELKAKANAWIEDGKLVMKGNKKVNPDEYTEMDMVAMKKEEKQYIKTDMEFDVLNIKHVKLNKVSIGFENEDTMTWEDKEGNRGEKYCGKIWIFAESANIKAVMWESTMEPLLEMSFEEYGNLTGAKKTVKCKMLENETYTVYIDSKKDAYKEKKGDKALQWTVSKIVKEEMEKSDSEEDD